MSNSLFAVAIDCDDPPAWPGSGPMCSGGRLPKAPLPSRWSCGPTWNGSDPWSHRPGSRAGAGEAVGRFAMGH
jgi:hypothetical protein